MSSPLLDELIKRFCCLPGVGQRSAQRMSYHLLNRDRTGGAKLAETLTAAMQKIGNCSQCRTLSEHTLCAICADERRQNGQICLVESTSDVHVIESAINYSGHYFVLGGYLSPIDNIGPEQLGVHLLHQRLQSGAYREMIIATNATLEGEATAQYIGQIAKQHGLRVMRIAHGVPLGGELEFTNRSTISHAFSERIEL